MLQRLLTSSVLLYYGISHVFESNRFTPNLPYLIAAVAGVFLLLGLWTPVAGISIAIAGIWVFLACSGHSLTAIIVAVLGATVAMIGPGMWSVDARLYGRKHIENPRR